MKIKIRSQLSKVDESLSCIREDSENIRKGLLEFGFKVSEASKGLTLSGKECNVYKVTGDEVDEGDDGCHDRHVTKEFANIEEMLVLADKLGVTLIYQNGEWEMFNDPYHFA